MSFTGHGNLGASLGLSTYPVIRFTTAHDTIVFNGNLDLRLERGEKVSVRYQKDNPSDAKVNTFICLWGDSIVYGLAPFMVLLAVFFMPDIVPKGSTIRLGGKRFFSLTEKSA